MQLVILGLMLVCSVLADNVVMFKCHQCGPIACFVLTGGGFNGKDIPATVATCAEAGTFPVEIRFKCDNQQCSEGCMMTEIMGDQIVKFCTSTEMGQQEIVLLDLLYQLQENDPTVSYDWCDCTSSGSVLSAIKTAFRWFSPLKIEEVAQHSRQ